jgi:hypothetical protein
MGIAEVFDILFLSIVATPKLAVPFSEAFLLDDVSIS